MGERLISIPATWAGLNVGELQEIYAKRDTPLAVVAAAAKVPIEEVKKYPQKTVDAAMNAVRVLLENKTEVFHKQFKLGGVLYGFIPDWDEFTAGEYADLDQFLTEGTIESAHNILAVLYRPVTRVRGDTHEIEPYSGVKHSEVMKKVRADVFGGALVFFCMNEAKLSKNLVRFLTRAAGVEVLQSTMGGITSSSSQRGKWRRILTRLRSGR